MVSQAAFAGSELTVRWPCFKQWPVLFEIQDFAVVRRCLFRAAYSCPLSDKRRIGDRKGLGVIYNKGHGGIANISVRDHSDDAPAELV